MLKGKKDQDTWPLALKKASELSEVWMALVIHGCAKTAVSDNVGKICTTKNGHVDRWHLSTVM